ncbi:TIGR01244 family sulfur transferase [Azohydromonas caseinilytica]|uniref:TIGR01244 family phosphatase n=1 Tax=Azohydromonas caseinilytica TaxID=2728836 RepID=A0A848F8S5_9BURK|nr:TIGR01244 family sulfur transferase [Azohydromonas caseinilytica]NML14650.1 TIGR01244 family phosphatase [Azohydromonas caseinilytica]
MSTPTELPVRALTAELCVAPQLPPEAMAEVARAGFRSVINNRPDFEGGPEQPTSAAVEAAARAAGLEYRHLPVAPGYQSPEEAAAFGQLLQELPKPVLAFCRTGTRSTKLFVQAQQQQG